MNKYIDISPEVAQSLTEKQPVIALESTLISHGMPWPENLQTCLGIEVSVRETGGIPATIAIINGRIKVGLQEQEKYFLAESGQQVVKCSRRDVAGLISQGNSGATTIAATLWIAGQAGIPIVASGGLGGVHRGASKTFDISADLDELARTPVAVVCSGPKIILDLPLTREYLETKGIPVFGYQSDYMAAFYCQSKELTVDYRFDTPQQLAEAISIQRSLNLGNGMVVSNPITQSLCLDYDVIEQLINEGMEEAAKMKITGKSVTPFLLKYLNENSGGKTLESNIALIKNNARLATQIAQSLCDQAHG